MMLKLIEGGFKQPQPMFDKSFSEMESAAKEIKRKVKNGLYKDQVEANLLLAAIEGSDEEVQRLSLLNQNKKSIGLRVV